MLVELPQIFWLAGEVLIEASAVDLLPVQVGTGFRRQLGRQKVEPDHDIFFIRDYSHVPIVLLVVLGLLDRLHDRNRIEPITIGI